MDVQGMIDQRFAQIEEKLRNSFANIKREMRELQAGLAVLQAKPAPDAAQKAEHALAELKQAGTKEISKLMSQFDAVKADVSRLQKNDLAADVGRLREEIGAIDVSRDLKQLKKEFRKELDDELADIRSLVHGMEKGLGRMDSVAAQAAAAVKDELNEHIDALRKKLAEPVIREVIREKPVIREVVREVMKPAAVKGRKSAQRPKEAEGEEKKKGAFSKMIDFFAEE